MNCVYFLEGVMPSGRDADKNGVRSSKSRNKTRNTSVSSTGSNVDGGSLAMEDNVSTSKKNSTSKHSDKLSRNKLKKKNRHSSGNDEKNQISTLKPLVEYSDVSSEELSSPEAGEIQSEESADSEDVGSQVSCRRDKSRNKHLKKTKDRTHSNSQSPKHRARSQSNRQKYCDGLSPPHHAATPDDEYIKNKSNTRRHSNSRRKEKKNKKSDKKSKHSPRSHKKRKKNKKRVSRSESREHVDVNESPAVVNRICDQSPLEGSPEIPVIMIFFF